MMEILLIVVDSKLVEVGYSVKKGLEISYYTGNSVNGRVMHGDNVTWYLEIIKTYAY